MTELNRNVLAARRRAAIDDLVIGNPRATAAHATFDYLIEHGALRDGKGKRCVLLVGPSQAGKSTILESYTLAKNTKEARERGEVPVLHVTLEANVTRKGLALNILEAIEDHGFAVGTDRASETVLLKRVRAALAGAKVQLLILDEFHHLVHSDSEKLASSVGETVKRMLIKGVCSMVLAGIPAAREPFTKNQQLLQRAEPEIELSNLAVQRREDVDLLLPFIAEYCERIGHVTGVENIKTLVDVQTIAQIIQVTGGVLGAVCNLIKGAVVVATLNGRDHLTCDDLALSAQRHFVASGLFKGKNPFTHAPSLLTEARR